MILVILAPIVIFIFNLVKFFVRKQRKLPTQEQVGMMIMCVIAFILILKNM